MALVSRCACIIVGLLSVAARPAEDPPLGEIRLDQALVLPATGEFHRTPLFTDELEHRRVTGTLAMPAEGGKVTLADGRELVWKRVAIGEDGFIRDEALSGGTAVFRLTRERAETMLLSASGPSTVFVNGVPRAGDPYGYGRLVMPVSLRQGENLIMCPCQRGNAKVTLTPLVKPVFLDLRDVTVPTLRTGEPEESWGALTVVNARSEAIRVRLEARSAQGAGSAGPDVVLAPESARKCAFPIRIDKAPDDKSIPIQVTLYELSNGADGAGPCDEKEIMLTIRPSAERQERTFVSGIDGSVQYYSVVPPKATGNVVSPGLLLTLHGAGVEASGQAACYAPKEDLVVVAPTNRRSFGFDWEDWGRMDALEVLDLAAREFHVDPKRVVLSGHSMGGHGTWQLGTTFANRFAAIGPSAGWPTFWSYAGAQRFGTGSAVEAILARAAQPSDTIALIENLRALGVYVLHGDADDNVPVDLARMMRTELAKFHADFAYFEQPGAGHWWGNACVDFPPMIEFLRRHARPATEDARRVEFATFNPGISSTCDWVTIAGQQKPLELSRVKIRLDAEKSAYEGVTWNIERIELDPVALRKARREQKPTEGERSIDAQAPWSIRLDDQRVDIPVLPASGGAVVLERRADSWTRIENVSPTQKGPRRNGPFKDVFRNRVLFVYGTHGSPEENAWAFAKARYDAETFWYRGNGSIDVVSDDEFVSALKAARPREPDGAEPPASRSWPQRIADPDRNIVVYGHASMNAAWSLALADGPVVVGAGAVHIGDRALSGENLACLFVYPRPGSDAACVGVVAGTGASGMRLLDRFPYFLSGVGYPDCMVISSDMLRPGETKGLSAVRAAGFFGNDWSVERGDFAFSE